MICAYDSYGFFQILAVARHCEVPTIESKLLAASQEPAPFAALFAQHKFPTIAPNPPCMCYLLLRLHLQRKNRADFSGISP